MHSLLSLQLQFNGDTLGRRSHPLKGVDNFTLYRVLQCKVYTTACTDKVIGSIGSILSSHNMDGMGGSKGSDVGEP